MSWRRILLLSFALIVVLSAATAVLLQRDGAATEMVRRQLGRLFRGEVTLDSASLQLGKGRLCVTNLRLPDPTTPGRSLVEIRDGAVEIELDPLAGRAAPRLVVLDGVTVTAGPIWPKAADLLTSATDTSSDRDAPTEVPAVQLRSATAKLQLCADQPPLTIDAISAELAPHAEAPLRMQLRGTARLVEPPAPIEVTGQIDLASGAMQFHLTTTAVPCSEAAVAALTKLTGIDRQELDLSGDIRSLAITCDVPGKDAVDPRPTFHVFAEFEHVRARSPRLPDLVHDARLRVAIDTAGRGSLRADVHQETELGTLDVVVDADGLLAGEGAIESVRLRASGRDLRIERETLAALGMFDIGRDIVEALKPTTGRADLELFLRDPHRSGGMAELDLVLRDVAMAYHGFGPTDRRIGFPLPMVGAKGRVHLRNDVITLDDVEATIAPAAGGGRVTLTGQIDTNQASGEETTLDIAGTGVAFDVDLRLALATLLHDQGQLYDQFSPTGRADVQVQVRPGSSLPGGFRVTVEPRSASMRWLNFPYSLHELQGTIEVDSDVARFEFRGRHGEGQLSMRGRLPITHPNEPPVRRDGGDRFEAMVDVDRLAVDDDLRDGIGELEPRLTAAWRDAEPSGAVSGQVKVWRETPSAPLRYDLAIELQDVDLRLPMRPWHAQQLGGQVLIQGDDGGAHAHFDALRGELVAEGEPPARLAALGSMVFGEETSSDLTLVVRDLDLSPQLGMTLARHQAMDWQTWQTLSPSGRVHLVAHERRRGTVPIDTEVIVHLVDVRSAASMLPHPAEQLTGELRIHNGELTFERIHGRMAGAAVACSNGRVRSLPAPDSRTEIAFEVAADDFPLDDGLANLFSGPLQRAVRERHLRGKADVDSLSLRFRVPGSDGGGRFETTLGGSIALSGVEMMLGSGREGIRVQELGGIAELADSTVTADGGRLTGAVRGSLSLFGQPLESIDASFRADAFEVVLDQLTARLHGGTLSNARADLPAVHYRLPGEDTPEGRLAGDLEFQNVDVLSLLAAAGWQDPPYRGAASGSVSLERLDGNDVISAVADGRLRIERADLGSVPVFTAIYAQLPTAVQPRFDFLDLAFRLDGQSLAFEDLQVRSEILAAKGEGRLDLDGYVDIRMEMDNLLGQSADPLVMPVIDLVAKNLVRFHLFGSLRDLHAERRWVTESSPARLQAVPMPPERTRPAAPPF